PEVAARLALYRDLIALRRAHPAVQTGGFRWLHVDDETVVFARESADETVLVLATRGDADVELPAGAVTGAHASSTLFGNATLAVADDGAVVLAAEGPAFAMWMLPGIAAPASVPAPAEEEVSRGVISAGEPTPADIVADR
ncbi:MAG: DUF3459 domain-containing protein, partial [Microbacterium sp.]